MVCQNQSIDDSDAPLARDLRLLVRERLKAGDSDAQVIDFLVARYGEFVLLRPRFELRTRCCCGSRRSRSWSLGRDRLFMLLRRAPPAERRERRRRRRSPPTEQARDRRAARQQRTMPPRTPSRRYSSSEASA